MHLVQAFLDTVGHGKNRFQTMSNILPTGLWTRFPPSKRGTMSMSKAGGRGDE